MSWHDFITTLPLVMPILAGCAILLIGVGSKGEGSNPLPPMLSLGGLLASILCSLFAWQSESDAAFGGALQMDRLGLLLSILAAVCALITVALSGDSLKRRGRNLGEFYVLCLFACSGMQMMSAAGNWLVMLCGLEIMSVAFYVLAGFFREQSRSVEASIKYFLTGSFATGLLLFGIALIFGGTNSLMITAVGPTLIEGGSSALLLSLGLAFMLAGLAFKVGAVPFHMWLPDVYQGAPTTVTGYMATGVKVAAFGIMIRVFCQMFQVESAALRDTFWWLAVLTMTVGNVTALAQKSVKRMLAYSSISHAGYLLIGIVSLNGGDSLNFSESTAAAAVLYYLIAYSVANLGAFGVLSMLESGEESDLSFNDLAGLRARYPLASFGLAIFMLSLAGIPGTGGFIGKFLLLGAAIDTADLLKDESFVLLAVLAVLNSVVSLYYYLRIPIQLYVRSLPEEEEGRIAPVAGRTFRPMLLLTIVGTLWLGFGPDVGFGVEAILGWVRDALSSLR